MEGTESVKRFGQGICALYARLSFNIEQVFAKDDKVAVFLKTQHLITDSQDFYRDNNIGVFKFKRGGKIIKYTEYFDPIKPGYKPNLLTFLNKS